MKAFNCIFGIFSIMGAIYCIVYPGIAFLYVGWIAAVLPGIWGAGTIIGYFAQRGKKDASKAKAAIGTFGLVAGIAAAVISLLAIFMPAMRLILDMVILGIFEFRLIIGGITSIAAAFKAKRAGTKTWVITLICGILVLLAGIYGVFHMLFFAQTIGMLMGILLMISGIRLVASVFEKG